MNGYQHMEAGTITQMLDNLQAAMSAFSNLVDFAPPPERLIRQTESMVRYQVAGHPFGKSHRGRKKWEKKQAAKVLTATKGFMRRYDGLLRRLDD